MLKITDSDIDNVQHLLLGHDESFDEQRREVIKCVDSKDVLACPGSGKTTALLAKLFIVASQLPLQSNKGICVLTHTNIAVNEIRKRMGPHVERLFSYPNHFGTIQTFVDKFLAIPEYVERFARRDLRINNDLYDEHVERYYHYRLDYTTKKWLDKKQEPIEYLRSLRFRPSDFALCEGLNEPEIRLSESSRSYKGMYALKMFLLKRGILCYDDAYSLGIHRVLSYPQLRDVFSERFAFVFIDEMQDTDFHQVRLLSLVFDPDKVVQQRIGDVNQSIYNAAKEEVVWEVRKPVLEITGSKRFSNVIARVIKSACIDPQEMRGNEKIKDISPTLIAFAHENIRNVLPRFGDLVSELQLQLQRNPVFKAVGWTGKQHDKYHTIPDYWPNYKQTVRTRKQDFANLWNYLVPQTNEVLIAEGANVYRKSIIRAFLRVLRLLDVNRDHNIPYNERTLLAKILEIDPQLRQRFDLKVTEWVLQIEDNLDVFENVKHFIETEFVKLFGSIDVNPARQFMSDRTPEPETESSFYFSNTYAHNPQVRIEVSTIHGVKGETHTATLYLETFYYAYDVLRIMEYLKGNYSKPAQVRTIQNLKMAYVGMSRPSHFLAVAIHNDHLHGNEEGLRNAGWVIDNELA